MQRAKRLIAALALALTLGAGPAYAQNVITGSWWHCVYSIYMPFYGWVQLTEYYDYQDGLSDPSYGGGWELNECYIVQVCYGEYGCQ